MRVAGHAREEEREGRREDDQVHRPVSAPLRSIRTMGRSLGEVRRADASYHAGDPSTPVLTAHLMEENVAARY